MLARRLAFALLVLGCLVAAPVRALDTAAAAATARELLAALKAGDAAKAAQRFDATMKGALPAEALAQLWPQLLGQVGELRSEGPQRWVEADGIVAILQRLEFAAAPLDFKVALRSDTGEVAGLFFTPASDEGTPIGEAKAAAAAPPPAATTSAPSGTPTQTATALLDKLEAGQFEAAAAMLEGPLASMLPADKLAAIWLDLAAKLGKVQARGPARVQPAGDNVAVVRRVDFAGGGLDVTVTVAVASGGVVGFLLTPAQAESTPPPADAPFVERPITIGTGGGSLDGLLTMPRGGGPFPCVIFVHGSGPQDRDETIGPNKPFRDLAWGLGERGIASIRYDKRTLAHQAASAAIASELTLDHESVLDAVAAVRLARSIPGLDPARLVVAGHSLGGMALPRVARLTPDVAALVFIATPAENPADAILRQSRYIAEADGKIDADEAKSLEAIAGQVAVAKSPGLSPQTPAALLPLGVPAAYWLYLRGLDVAKEAAQIPLPMLFVQGGRDYQVRATDFEVFRAALAGRRDVKFVLLPALNHLLVAGEGPSKPEEYLRPGRIDADVPDAVAGFVARLPVPAAK